jgi:hypothetical protein
MSDVDRWREKASTLRELAKFTVDAEAKRVLLMVAKDCEQLSTDTSGVVFVPHDEMIQREDIAEGNIIAFRALEK